MSSVKENAIRLIEGLPEDCTLEDIHYHLYVREKIERAMEKIGDGEGISQEEAERRVGEWLESSGSNPPGTTSATS